MSIIFQLAKLHPYFMRYLGDGYKCYICNYLTEAERRIFASMNYVNIGSDNDLSPERRLLCQVDPWKYISVKFNRNSNNFTEEGENRAFENVVCDMAAILFRPQRVNKTWIQRVLLSRKCAGIRCYHVGRERKEYHNVDGTRCFWHNDKLKARDRW